MKKSFSGKLILACDHGGLELKRQIAGWLEEQGIEFHDAGTFSADSVDYPDYARLVAEGVLSGRFQRGVLVCGSGIGMSIAANRHRGIRAALCHSAYTARMCRLHNDANVLCLGGRTLGAGEALDILETFLSTEFEGGRHQRRLELIDRP